MKFRKPRHSERVLPVEITPMIDVVFLLIIFFMTTAQFARLTRAEIDLPQERGEQEEAEEAGLVVNLTREGQVIINDTEVPLSEMMAMVREEMARSGSPAGLKLLLRADREASAARLNEIIKQLQDAGVYNARVATEVP